MISNLIISQESLGADIHLRANLQADYKNQNIDIYLFRKENSDLTSQDVLESQNFVVGNGPKPTGIEVHKWYWYENDQAYANTQFSGGTQHRNTGQLDFYDVDVEIGQFFKREATTSGNQSTITASRTISEVYGIFERSDIYATGLDYYTGGSFSGKVITTGSLLPSSNSNVYIEYLAQYDDAIRYYYYATGYNRETGQWIGEQRVNGYAAYTHPYVMPDVKKWVMDGLKKVLAAKDLKSIPVLLEYPQQEQTSFIYISRDNWQSTDQHWADQIGISSTDGAAHGRHFLVPINVEWATPDFKTTNLLTLTFASLETILHQHLIRQKGYYTGYTPKFDFGGDQLVPGSTSNDKPLYMCSFRLLVPVSTYQQRGWDWLADSTFTLTTETA